MYKRHNFMVYVYDMIDKETGASKRIECSHRIDYKLSIKKVHERTGQWVTFKFVESYLWQE